MTSRPPIASCSRSEPGHFGPAGRDQDGVVGRVLGPAERAVAVQHVDVGVAEPREPLGRAPGQLGVALDRVDLGGDLGQHGGGVARAGADLEHAFAAA